MSDATAARQHEPITIPSTITKARKELAGLGALLAAKEWSRAAIVYAFTLEGEAGRPAANRAEMRDKRLTFRAFAELGIAGLSSDHTVARYHRAWAEEVEAGRAEPSTPGEAVKLPTSPWPPNAVQLSAPGAAQRAEAVAEAAGVGVGNVAQVLKNPGAVRAAIEHDPKVRELAAQAIAEAETTEAVELVAEARGVPVEQVRAKLGHVVRDIRQEVQRLTEAGTTRQAALKTVARVEKTQAKVRDQQAKRAEQKPAGGMLAWNRVSSELGKARKAMRDATLLARESGIEDEELLALMREEAGAVKELADLFLLAISATEVDWDSAAQDLLT